MGKRLFYGWLLFVSTIFSVPTFASSDLNVVEKKTLYADPNTPYILAGDLQRAKEPNEIFALFVYICKGDSCSSPALDNIAKIILLTDSGQSKSLLAISGATKKNNIKDVKKISNIVKHIKNQYEIDPNKVFIIYNWNEGWELEKEQHSRTQKSEKTDTLSTKLVGQDLVVDIEEGIGSVKFGMSQEEIIKYLGKPDKIQGPKKECLNYSTSLGISLLVHRTRGLVIVDCWSNDAEHNNVWNGGVTFGGSTKEGIKMGASREQIEATYGKADRIYDKGPNKAALYYVKTRALFTIKNERLFKISITTPKPKTQK